MTYEIIIIFVELGMMILFALALYKQQLEIKDLHKQLEFASNEVLSYQKLCLNAIDEARKRRVEFEKIYNKS